MASLARQGEQPAQEVLPPRTLLWPAIKARLEPLEVREVKALIGAEAVEDNEVGKRNAVAFRACTPHAVKSPVSRRRTMPPFRTCALSL